MPRHGYELERVIEQRCMREWTQIAFSSIYFVLGKLEEKGLVIAEKKAGPKSKKTYSINQKGRRVLTENSLRALANHQPTFSSLLIGMLHWPFYSKKQALFALETRKVSVEQELERMKDVHFHQQPLPDYVDSLFDFATSQWKTELHWIEETLEYMQIKPWI